MKHFGQLAFKLYFYVNLIVNSTMVIINLHIFYQVTRIFKNVAAWFRIVLAWLYCTLPLAPGVVNKVNFSHYLHSLKLSLIYCYHGLIEEKTQLKNHIMVHTSTCPKI